MRPARWLTFIEHFYQTYWKSAAATSARKTNFWTISHQEFPVHLTSLPELPEFWVNEANFGKFNNSWIFRKLSQNFPFKSN